MKRLISGALAALLLIQILSLSGCEKLGFQRFEATFYDVFDTITVIVGFERSEAQFKAEAGRIHSELLEYHRLYDVYGSYEGIVNIKSINDAAGGEALSVDGRITDLLLFCRELCSMTEGKVDITLGPVLKVWHEAREKALDSPESAAPPDTAELSAALGFCGMDKLDIDEVAGTVRLTVSGARLDVGAVAKGYAAEQVKKTAPEGYLISLGGNVVATGPKPGGDSWTVGIQDPDSGGYLTTVPLKAASVVTSGDYQRYFEAGGRRYSHIIDPDTLFPGEKWRSVTVICSDSGLADGLSTALFLMDREQGAALARSCGAEAMWVNPGGEIFTTEGFYTPEE